MFHRFALSFVLFTPLIAHACFREARPCDDAGFNAVVDQCKKDKASKDECKRRLAELGDYCEGRVNAE